ncbi:hypothetical protein [Streptomyces sp. NBC_00986]|uniref:hypothetical protein n=1 Tax=Streptomyces sp. NBC_00986 TaxID=2903702 RepID=UPI003868C50C|nr:hypothetical protein OG504_19875 [Streptomyces sp. NBC_00986]
MGILKRGEQRSEESGPYWKQRSWQASAGFLALVVVLGVIATLTSGSGTADRAAAQASKGPLSGTVTKKDGRPGGCRTDDSAGDAIPTSVPKDISWHTLGIGRVPVSASAGPTRMQGAVWWCFAHTPMGAVLAATDIPTQMSGSQWRTVTDQQVVAGQGRELFVFQRTAVPDTAGSDSAPTTSSYAGFQVTSYTSGAASVVLLIKSDQGYAKTTVYVHWSGGDWKIQPDGSGSLYSQLTSEQSAVGYTLWGA